MLRRLKEFFASPYAAPLTQPAKSVARWAKAPVENFLEGVKYGVERQSAKPVYLRVFKALRNADSFYSRDHTKTITWAGVILGGLSAPIGAALGMHAMGFGWAGMTAAGIGVTSVGMMAGPFVVAGAVAVLGFAAGCCIAAVPAVLEGLYVANKYRKTAKLRSAATQAVPQLASASANVKEEAGAMLRKIRAMPRDAQAPLLKALNEQYHGAGLSDTEGVLKFLEAIPAADQQAFVKTLQVKLKNAFEEVARQESDAAMALHTAVKTGGPLRLKLPRG